MRTAKTIVHQMAIDAWNAGAVLLVLCLMLEAAERGFVSRVFNVLWLLLFVLVVSLAVTATHPGAAGDPAHRPAKAVAALLKLAAVLAAAIAWFLLPSEFGIVWRAAAAGMLFVAALSVRAAFDKNA